MNEKGIVDILAECTDEEALVWFEDLKKGLWPGGLPRNMGGSGMPMPRESMDVLWHKVQKRAIDVKPKPKEQTDGKA